MKKYRLLFFVLLSFQGFIYAQNKALLYDFGEIPQSLMVNPGVRTDFKWYAGVPLVSQISFQAGSSGIAVGDIFADDGIDINDKIRDKAINGMSEKDELSGNFQVELLNIGFRGKNPALFYSGGIYMEGDAIGYWFKDYAILGFEGNADKLGQEFDLSHLKTRGEVLNVFHFGVNKTVNKNLTLGIRAKVYSSIFDFKSTKNSGYFVTEEGQNNFLSTTLNADMQLQTSGLSALENAEENGTITNTIVKRGFFGGNLGVGIDLGFTYNLTEQTVLTASLLDLGLIYNVNNTSNYTLKGTVTTEGVEVILPGALSDPDIDFWQDLVDEVKAQVPYEENIKSYLTFRPTKLYAAIRYDFGEKLPSRSNYDCGRYATANRARYTNSLGGQLYMINRPRGPQAALTAFYTRRFGNFLALKGTYTIDKFSYTNLGLGLNLQAGPVNFYVLADNLLGYRDLSMSKYTSFQIGLNIISWGKN